MTNRKLNTIVYYFDNHKRLKSAVFENTETNQRVMIKREKVINNQSIFGQYYSKTSGICSRFFDAVKDADKPIWILVNKE